MRTNYFVKSLAGAILSMALLSGAYAETPYDVKKPAWFGGITVWVFAQFPAIAGGSGPADASPTLRDVDAYLVGPIDANNPYGQEVPIPAIDPNTGAPILDANGNVIIVARGPAHDNTFTQFIPKNNIADIFGYWVIAGPNATPDKVHTRPAPENSLAGGALAYEIKIGNKFRPLTSNAVIQYGLKTGLLTANPFGWGGVAWTQIMYPQ
ncbi:MAG: hypothetical protein H0W44_00955 [Gammaproteobacteria bacterium]|nr:hypothetical protein [Gammaproteobacteria bacterium]